MLQPATLYAFWVGGMLSYAAAYYRTELARKPGGPGFWSWLVQLDVLTTKIIGLAIMGVWTHQWTNPAFNWLQNVLPHRPFAAFVFGFFVDVIALKVRQLIQQKFNVDLERTAPAQPKPDKR